jgi:hypothetical protein
MSAGILILICFVLFSRNQSFLFDKFTKLNGFCCTDVALKLTPNVLQLPEGGDFEALHCQPSTNFDRSTKLDLTTSPPLLGRCCAVYKFKAC